jgi:hypothetical protein
MLVKVSSKDTATVVAALSQHVLRLPASLRRSLTWDHGLEMTQHKSFTVDTEVKVYFCDPQSPWQRGSNENTNYSDLIVVIKIVRELIYRLALEARANFAIAPRQFRSRQNVGVLF